MSDIIFRLPEIYRNAEEEYNRIISDESAADFRPAEIIGVSGNTVAQGDNRKYMKFLLENGYRGKLNMIYTDPPFFSKTDYTINVKVGDSKKRLILAKNHAFTDKWEDGMGEYLESMAVSLMLMKDLLADDGSIFVHLDWHSAHYIKIIMDRIFGEKNFINEIIWNYKSGGVSKRYFAKKHDIILFYSKTGDYYFKPQKEKSYNRGFKPYRFKGVQEYKDEVGWYTMVSMKDVWQIDMVGRTSSERTGYATQKPEALIRRILESVTQDGDLCGDFFCGSGTLGAVCGSMNRDFLMCDSSAPAVMMSHRRLTAAGISHTVYSEAVESDSVFTADIEMQDIEGIIDTVGVSIAGLNYRNPEDIGVDEKNMGLLETVLKYHYDQLIEYWCIDTDYDGSVVKPEVYSCRDNNGIDLALVVPASQIRRMAVKIIDVFGNEFLYDSGKTE